MPDQPDNPAEELAAVAESAAEPGRSSLFAMAKAALFLSAVVGAECLLAYWYLPSPEQTAVWAESALTTPPVDGPADPDESADGPVEEPIDQVEVDLEEFSVSAFQPISNTTLRIDFHLYGIVRAEDEAEFHTRLQENRHRFREQILVIMRSAELRDLTDAGLGLIKRRILEKTNATLGSPLLQAVIFSDFSFVEQ